MLVLLTIIDFFERETKMKRSKTACILSILLLLSAFSSCGTQTTLPSDTATAPDTAGPASAEITEETTLKADIPSDTDYNGYTFRVLARAAVDQWENFDLVAAETNGDTINDAVYNRNETVKELLNIDFEQIPVNGYDVLGPANRSILAASDEYDIIMPSITDCAGIAQKGYLIPLQDLPYMDLSKPWYDQRCIDELAINEQNYLFFSDITVRNLDAIWIYVFNKSMLESYDLEDPYELIAKDQWTWDKMNGMCKATTADLDGNGTMDKEDQWGLVAHDYVITAGYVGSGERIATAQPDGSIKLTMNNSRVYDLIDKILDVQPYWIRYSLTAQKYSKAKPYGFDPKDNYQELLSVFTSGHALFMGECMAVIEDMRSSTVDFGVVPTPKLSEDQKGYYSAVNYIAACMAVPITVADTERTSVIIEAWSAESHKTLLPAYYDIAMKGKYTRDVMSSDMLDVILGSKSYDLGIYYGWGQLSDRFCSLVYEGSTDFASMYQAYEGKAQDDLNKFLGEFGK